jgi:hypothetical protein
MEYRGSMETKSQITFVTSFSLLQTNHSKEGQLTMSSPNANQPDASDAAPDHGAADNPNQAKPRPTVTNPYANLKKPAPNPNSGPACAPGFVLPTAENSSPTNNNSPTTTNSGPACAPNFFLPRTNSSSSNRPATNSSPAVTDSSNKKPTQTKKTPSSKYGGTTVKTKRNGEYTKDSVILGMADSTKDGRANAVRILNITFNHLGFPQFQNLKSCHVEEDNIEHLLHRVIATLCTQPLPAEFGEGFVPKNPNSKQMWMITSILTTLGQMLMCFREKFPKHPTWPRSDTDNPNWWTQAIKEGKNEWTRQYQQVWSKDPDLVFGRVKCMAMYRKLPEMEDPDERQEICWWFREELERSGFQNLDCPWSTFSLQSVNRKLFINAHPLNPKSFAELSMINFTHNKCLRAGEIKFDKYTDCMWISALQCWETLKCQQKTLSEGISCPVVPNPEDPLLCPIFHYGSYVCQGEGLVRTRQQIEDGTADFVYPELYMSSSAAVARKITTIVRSGLPTDAPQELKDQISGKSLRRGAVTELAIHEGTSILDVCARSGHSTGTNADKYNNKRDPSGSLLGGRILSGHRNLMKPARMPAPWWLSRNEKPGFDRIIDYLLSGCNVPSFQRGGRHFRFFCHLVSQQICHFEELRDEFGEQNGWVQGWIEIARNVELCDPQHPEITPVQVLSEWSDIMARRNRTENSHVHARPIGTWSAWDVATILRNNVERTQKLEKDVERLRADIRESLSLVKCALNMLTKEVRITRGAADTEREKQRTQEQQAKKSRARFALMEKCVGKDGILEKLMDTTPDTTPVKFAPPIPSFKPQDFSPASPDCEVVSPGTAQADFARKQQQQAPIVQTQHITNNNKGPVIVMGTQANFASLPDVNVEPVVQSNDLLLSDVLPKADQVAWAKARPFHERKSKKGTTDLTYVLGDLHKKEWYAKEPVDVPFHDPCRTVHTTCEDVPSAFRYTMELVEYCISPEEREFLREPIPKGQSVQAFMSRYVEIKDKCMRKLCEFEGRSYDDLKEAEANRAGQRTSCTFSAMSKRVKNYKNYINQMLNLTVEKRRGNRNDPTALRERDQLAVVLEPGQTTIQDHFGLNKKRRRTEDDDIGDHDVEPDPKRCL